MATKKDTEKTAGQLRSEELIFQRKSIWETSDKKTLKKIQEFSEGYIDFLNNCTAVYEDFEGNFGDISHCKTRSELPEKAQKYLARIEEVVGVPVKFIGTGAGRDAIIVD